MTTIERLRDRYHNDAVFHAAVTMLEKLVLDAELSPSEIRDAAMYAVFRVEIRHAHVSIPFVSGKPPL